MLCRKLSSAPCETRDDSRSTSGPNVCGMPTQQTPHTDSARTTSPLRCADTRRQVEHSATAQRR